MPPAGPEQTGARATLPMPPRKDAFPRPRRRARFRPACRRHGHRSSGVFPEPRQPAYAPRGVFGSADALPITLVVSGQQSRAVAALSTILVYETLARPRPG